MLQTIVLTLNILQRSVLLAALILSLVLPAQNIMAADKPEIPTQDSELTLPQQTEPPIEQPLTTKSADFEVRFKQVVYSLETVPQVIEDISQHHVNAAGGAITKSVEDELNARFTAAKQLMTIIMQDTSMPERERAEKSMAIAEALGVLLLKVIRQQGEEKVNEANRVVDVQGAEGFLREFGLDFKRFFVPTPSADGSLVVGPLAILERVRRDQTARTMIEQLDQFARVELPKLGDESKLRLAASKYWNFEIIERATKLREIRVKNQRRAAAVYFGLAFVGYFTPLVDSVGLVLGRDGFTTEMSATLYASIWMSIGLLKFKAASMKTVNLLKDLRDFLNSEIKIVSDKRSLRKKIDESVKSSDEAVQGIQCKEGPFKK